MKGFANVPVRFLVVDTDPETEEMDLFEVNEQAFIAHPGSISYSRYTLRENGASQITLTKWLDV